MEQPGPGGRVRDRYKRTWTNTSDNYPFQPRAANWELDSSHGFDPESWIRVCEYAPLTVLDPGLPAQSTGKSDG